MRLLNIIASKLLPKPIFDRFWRWKHWKNYSSRFEETIQYFVLEKGITSPTEVERCRKKLVKAFVKDNWYPEEFYWLNYDHLSPKGIKEFVSNREANRFWEYQNSNEIYLLTCDKALTYHHFKDYFNRELVSVNTDSPESIKEFNAFVENHSQFIVKPTYGNYGNGVRIIDSSDYSDVNLLTEELMKAYPDGFVAEELIVQCNELASFHPSSVNTVRLTTVRMSNGDIYIIHRPFIRFGQRGRCVDNGGNGGIFAGIDYETGIIKATIDERMNRFVVHPDTGKILLGYKIPQWEEAKAFVVQLAKVLPDLNYCGWDIALTNQGWVMVEANGKGLFIGFQMPTQEGFREEFEYIKQRCGYKG